MEDPSLALSAQVAPISALQLPPSESGPDAHSFTNIVSSNLSEESHEAGWQSAVYR